MLILQKGGLPIGGNPRKLPDVLSVDEAAKLLEAAPASSTRLRSALPMAPARSEEHTSELQSLMRISYAVFCLKIKITHLNTTPYSAISIQSFSRQVHTQL